MTDALVASPIARAVGWAILQSLWQGALLGVLTAAALLALRHHSARRRYAIAWTGLLVMAAAFVATAAGATREHETISPPQYPDTSSRLVVSADGSQPFASGQTATSAARTPIPTWWTRERLQAWSVGLVPLWIVGMLVLSVRLAGGWLLIGRIRRSPVRPLSDAWGERVEAIVNRLRIRQAVAVVESRIVNVPTVIGWVRPIVLLPASVLAGLPVEQLEAIVAHELAHVKRRDYLANVLQSVIEVVLFYHPACWWISHQIRSERENCCDDVAAEHCGSRLTYARALAELEALRGNELTLGLAATDGPLMRRVRRLLGASSVADTAHSGWMVSGVIAALVALAITGASASTAMRGADGAEQKSTRNTGRTIPPNEGVLQGQIADAESGRPIAGARIEMYSNPRGVAPRRAGHVYEQSADGDGRFEIAGISPGEYFVAANAPGYVLTYFGRSSPSGQGTAVAIDGGRITANVDIRVIRSGVITGRVFADSGEGLFGVEIEVLRNAGRGSEEQRAVGFAQTEDGGVYRVANLPPGDYYVRAYVNGAIRPTRGNASEAYAATFFPDGTAVDGAQPIRIAAGQEQSNIDFTLATLTTRVVRGRLVDPGGPSLARALVILVSRDHVADDERLKSSVDKNGRFEVRNVVPGDYRLMVNDSTDYRRWMSSTRALAVVDDVTDVEIEATRTARIDGRMTRAGGRPLPFDVGSIDVAMQYNLGGPIAMRTGIGAHRPGVQRDGSFFMESPAGPALLEISGLPPGWAVRSARLDGIDIADRQFDLTAGAQRRLEIVLTDRTSVVSGSVTDRSGRPLSAATVIVFPEDASRRQAERLTRSEIARQDGTYEIADLPAGDYLAIAVESIAPDAWKTSAVMERLSSMATRLRLDEGERMALTLKASSAPSDLVRP